MLGHIRKVPAVLAVLIAFFAAATPAHSAPNKISGEAYYGEPFGVGCVDAVLPGSEAPEPLGWQGLAITEKRNRVLYPAVVDSPLSGVVKDVLSDSRRPAARLLGEVIEGRGRAKIYFLFRGREPLELSVQSQSPHAAGIAPREDAAGRQRLLQAWWRHYSGGPGLLRAGARDPQLVHNYLCAMLAHRLGLKQDEARARASWKESVARELSLIAGTESLRLEVERLRFLPAPGEVESPDQPLPSAIESEPAFFPEPAADAAVEPLALRVPAEWFYVRFGSFTNYLWFQDTLNRIGGDFQNLVDSRGLDRGTRARFEIQLATRADTVSRFFGEAVVGDVAIVGTDLFAQEGGAYGLLFQSRASGVLNTTFAQQRLQWRQKFPGTEETHLKISGHDVSLLASPDGRVRSYYAVDGDFHLLTTSEALARRFLEVRSGKGSLGDSAEFRYARTLMPLSRSDAVFAYLSTGFFRNLLSPQYRVEMMRRLEAIGDIDLAQMAALAAAAEGKPAATIADLVAGGFLPPGFGARPDGSRVVFEQGEIRDSLRGKKGLFVPIPDMQTRQVTRTEAAAYQQIADLYRNRLAQLDPVFAGIGRQAIDKDRDRVAIDIRTTPLAKHRLDWLSRLVGPADTQRIPAIPEDSLALQIVLPRQRVFAGLQRIGSEVEMVNGTPLPLGGLHNLLVGYVGATDEAPMPGWFPFRPSGPPDADGYTQGERGLWRRAVDAFTVYSLHRNVLARVTPQLRLEDAQRPAQVRFRASDLSQSPLAPLVNAWGYARTRETSLGNIRLLHQIVQQLRVPGEAARTAAECLLNAKLVCPLGGQYVYKQSPKEVGFWTSTALEGTRRNSLLLAPKVPEGYQAPPLHWFRGMELDAAVSDTAVEAHIQLDTHWPPPKAEMEARRRRHAEQAAR